ncbi:MAG: HPF/RaiA family ribosome-associated protein, partial [Erysipelotrichaceae bacterium]
MKVLIYGKNVEVTEALQQKVEKKLNFLEKYFIIDENVVANVVLKVHPTIQKIEIT